VVDARSQDAGFTPGFASVLTCADGSRLFVKAASVKAQAAFAAAYREEARKLSLLPDAAPAPRLLWSLDDDWVVLGFEAYDGSPPRRPWRPTELERALDLAEEIGVALDPVPATLGLRPLVMELPELVDGWSGVARLHPDWPHLAQARELAAAFADLPDLGFCHSDFRDDNILLGRGGGAVACDWNWPALAPRWLDTVDLLAGARGDGVDVQPILARRRLTRDVDPEHIDRWLAALCGYMLLARAKPVPASSPHLRDHAAWYADVLWSWLSERRGWTCC
jgi:hypothetical protein